MFMFKSELIDYQFINSNKAKTVLFLHGWGGNKNSFISTQILLENNYNILTLTLPTTQQTIEVWSMWDYVELVKALLELNNVFNPIVICHSFGFRVATLLNRDTKIEKIVVTGGAGMKKTGRLKLLQQTNNSILLSNKKFSYLFNSLASKDYKSLSTTNKKTFQNVVNLPTNRLIKFSCPMLLFWGDKDKETKLWIAKKLKKQNNTKLIKVPGGHFAYLTHSSLFNHEVKEFLK